MMRKGENGVPAVLGRGSRAVEICWPNRKRKTVCVCKSREILWSLAFGEG